MKKILAFVAFILFFAACGNTGHLKNGAADSENIEDFRLAVSYVNINAWQWSDDEIIEAAEEYCSDLADGKMDTISKTFDTLDDWYFNHPFMEDIYIKDEVGFIWGAFAGAFGDWSCVEDTEDLVILLVANGY